jgi:hypothetical protein
MKQLNMPQETIYAAKKLGLKSLATFGSDINETDYYAACAEYRALKAQGNAPIY